MYSLHVELSDYAFYIDLPNYKWETPLEWSKYFFSIYKKFKNITAGNGFMEAHAVSLTLITITMK